MRLLYLIIPLSLSACNQGNMATPLEVRADTTSVDSLSLVVDSTNSDFKDLYAEFSETVDQVTEKINNLTAARDAASQKIVHRQQNVDAFMYEPVSDDAKEVYALRQKVREYEDEIGRLKYRLYRDSVTLTMAGKKSTPQYDIVEPEKPNDKSLVITLEGTEPGASIWIMESNRKSKKIMKGYYNCQRKDLDELGAIQAKQYKGVYFFNDVPTGKYLIKVCALYGDWVEVKRKDAYQTVAMKVSPPIQ